MSKKIDFFIIGAQKSATTSIYEYLNSIDDVAMPMIKEMQVFTNEKLYEDFPHNICSFYKKGYEQKLLGMADVEILYAHEHTAKRIHKHNPDAKIIIMLRNPIDRAYSSYWFSRKNQREDVETFEEAIQLEEERKKTLSQNDRLALTYLDVSMYYKQVKEFIDTFGNVNVLVLTMEEFVENKEKEFSKVLKFLEIDENKFDKNMLKKRFNEGGAVKNKLIQKVFNRDNFARRIYSNLIPLKLRMKLRSLLINPLLQKNSIPVRNKDIAVSTKNNLQSLFKDDVENLSKLIEKNCSKIWFSKIDNC